MAKIKFGAMITDARGKLEGIVYSKSKYGSYARRKVTPINPNSAAQSAVRGNFSDLSKAFSNVLTDAQRTAWAAFAASYPVTDIFGNSQVLSAISMYQRINRMLDQVAEARLDDPPADMAVTALLTVTPSIVVGTSTMNVAFTATPLDATHKLYVSATGRLNPGQAFFKSELRHIYSSAAAGVSPLNVWASYVAVHGAPVVGSKIGFLVAAVNTDNGAVSVGIKIAVVAA